MNKKNIFLDFFRKNFVFVMFALSFVFWFVVFAYSQPPKDESLYTDHFSGENVSMEAINDRQVHNPDQPFYIGFDSLTEYGVFDDDKDYIRAFLSNFFEYKQDLKFAKISFVKNSFHQKLGTGIYQQYDFKLGVNDDKIYNLSASTNIVDETISLSLDRGGVVLQKKQFNKYPSTISD